MVLAHDADELGGPALFAHGGLDYKPFRNSTAVTIETAHEIQPSSGLDEIASAMRFAVSRPDDTDTAREALPPIASS